MAKMNRTAIYNVAIKQFRNLARNSDGKWQYEDALNKVCFDLFGKKGVASKLAPKSKVSRIEKCIESFDFDALIGILADDKAAHNMRVAVKARHALAAGKYGGKSLKTIKKSYKKIIEALSDKFQIEKASDDLFAELDRALDEYDEYDLDDDDIVFSSAWEDDNGPITRASRKYGKTAKHKNELARLIYGGSKYDEDDDDEDDDDINDKNITKIVNVLENLSDRLDNLEAANDDGDDYYPTQRRAPRSNMFRNPVVHDGWEPVEDDDDDDELEYYPRPPRMPDPPAPPTPAEMTYKSDMQTVLSAISGINTNMVNLSKAVSDTNTGVNSMKSDLAATMRNVADIMDDLYGDDTNQADQDPVYPIRDSDKQQT